MNSEDGGKPHLRIGQEPSSDQRIEVVYALISVAPDGGEGIYGQQIGGHMMNFAVHTEEMAELLEAHIREAGSIEVARREGRRLEWRTFKRVGESDVIT